MTSQRGRLTHTSTSTNMPSSADNAGFTLTLSSKFALMEIVRPTPQLACLVPRTDYTCTVLPAFIEAWPTANEEIANEYMQHLYCPDGWVSNNWQPCGHQLQGISKPAFFDTYDDAYDLDRRTAVLKERDDD